MFLLLYLASFRILASLNTLNTWTSPVKPSSLSSSSVSVSSATLMMGVTVVAFSYQVAVVVVPASRT